MLCIAITRRSNLYFARLYRIVQELHDLHLTGVPWPAWQAAIGPVRASCKKLTVEADYHMPRMYKMMVICAVNSHPHFLHPTPKN